MIPTQVYRNPVGMAIGQLLARASLGLYFAIAGYNKVFKLGLGPWMERYKETQPDWLPDIVGLPFGYVLPFAELILGITLTLGLFGRVSAALITFLLISIIIGANTITDGSKPFHANLIFVSLAALLIFIGPGLFSIDRYLGWARLPHEPDAKR